MRINSINNKSFKGFKYTKEPISNICRENIQGCFKSLESKDIDTALKSVVETNSLLSSLAKDTDVFVNSHLVKYEGNFLGIFKVIFKDPYDVTKKYVDEISIQDECSNNQEWMQKLKKHLNKFPENYTKLKDKTNSYCGIRILRDNLKSTYGYIVEGFMK